MVRLVVAFAGYKIVPERAFHILSVKKTGFCCIGRKKNCRKADFMPIFQE